MRLLRLSALAGHDGWTAYPIYTLVVMKGGPAARRSQQTPRQWCGVAAFNHSLAGNLKRAAQRHSTGRVQGAYRCH
jgi:hypothetical protein